MAANSSTSGAPRENTGMTTIAGRGFVELGLARYNSAKGRIGLPGLGDAATLKLAEHGITTHEQLFGKYLLLGRDRTKFFDFLENEVKVRFVGGPSGTQQESRDRLFEALETKYNKIKEY